MTNKYINKPQSLKHFFLEICFEEQLSYEISHIVSVYHVLERQAVRKGSTLRINTPKLKI